MSQSRRAWIFIIQVQVHTAWSGPHIVEMLALDFNTLPRCCAQRRKHPALLRQIGFMVLKSSKNWMELDLRQFPLFNVRLSGGRRGGRSRGGGAARGRAGRGRRGGEGK